MSDSNWHYAQGQQTYGPVTLGALRDLCIRGVVQRSSLVWTDEMPEWAAAETVPTLWDRAPSDAGNAGVIGYQAPALGRIRYAGFWRRFVAFLIDSIIVGIASAVVAGVVSAIGGAFHPTGAVATAFNFHVHSATTTFAVPPAGSPGNPVSFAHLFGGNVLSIIAAWLYNALMESSRHQATFGKMALRLYVTDLSEGRIGFGRATGRYFGKMLSNLTLLIGFIIAGFTKRKQALHDLLAGTLVLRR